MSAQAGSASPAPEMREDGPKMTEAERRFLETQKRRVGGAFASARAKRMELMFAARGEGEAYREENP